MPKITHEGRTMWPREWAEEIGIKAKTLRSRLRRGETLEEIMTRPHRPPTQITHEGRTMLVREWAVEIGVSRKTIENRISKHGHTIADIIAEPRLNKKPITHDGRTMWSQEWAEEIGVCNKTIRNRLERGETMADIIETGPRPPGSPPKHGMTRTPTHYSWKSMRTRCLNPNHRSYPHYGGRGITVCDRWLGNKGSRTSMKTWAKGQRV